MPEDRGARSSCVYEKNALQRMIENEDGVGGRW